MKIYTIEISDELAESIDELRSIVKDPYDVVFEKLLRGGLRDFLNFIEQEKEKEQL